MQRWIAIAAMAAGLVGTGTIAAAQDEAQGQGQAVVTVLPKSDKQPTANVAAPSISLQVNGKQTAVTNWRALRSPQDDVELVLLIDGGARVSLGRELDEMTHFIQNLPPNVKVAVGYMVNGRAQLTGPLTGDHAKAAQGVHLPMGSPGTSASPYFCLSSLAKGWPSNDPQARREVLMITDGVDQYERQYDPNDPYVQSAINDAVRAHLLVYSIYWTSNGRADANSYQNDAGQNLLLQVDQATGGTSYWQGMGNPVTFEPYFDDLSRRLNNQYELDFRAPVKSKAEIANLKVKTSTPDVKVEAPQRVAVTPGSAPAE